MLPLPTQALLATYNTLSAASGVADHYQAAQHLCSDIAEQLLVFEHADSTLTFAKNPGLPQSKPASISDTEGMHYEQARLSSRHTVGPI